MKQRRQKGDKKGDQKRRDDRDKKQETRDKMTK